MKCIMAPGRRVVLDVARKFLNAAIEAGVAKKSESLSENVMTCGLQWGLRRAKIEVAYLIPASSDFAPKVFVMRRISRLGKHASRPERRAGRQRQGRLGRSLSHRQLRIEALEARLALTGNLAVLDAYVLDSNGGFVYYTDGGIQFQNTANNGEEVGVALDFSTQDLPADASYRINCVFNGVSVNSEYINAGAGLSGINYWNFGEFGYFTATPGANQLIVTVDPDQSVAETTYSDNTLAGSFTASAPQVAGSTYIYSAAQIRAAYGVDSIPNFGSAPADGSGQTIAIVDAYNNPTALSDLDSFDQFMCASTTSTETLYQQYGPASSFLTVYNQSGTDITANIGTSGSNGVPPVDTSGGWEGEESLDMSSGRMPSHRGPTLI